MTRDGTAKMLEKLRIHFLSPSPPEHIRGPQSPWSPELGPPFCRAHSPCGSLSPVCSSRFLQGLSCRPAREEWAPSPWSDLPFARQSGPGLRAQRLRVCWSRGPSASCSRFLGGFSGSCPPVPLLDPNSPVLQRLPHLTALADLDPAAGVPSGPA